MADIVFINNGVRKQDLYTTSDIIAIHTGVEYRKLKTVIRNHLKEFEELGISAPYGDEINTKKKRKKEIVWKSILWSNAFSIGLITKCLVEVVD